MLRVANCQEVGAITSGTVSGQEIIWDDDDGFTGERTHGGNGRIGHPGTGDHSARAR